jgi:hypothetical protein
MYRLKIDIDLTGAKPRLDVMISLERIVIIRGHKSYLLKHKP